jgi:hypothetical protein
MFMSVFATSVTIASLAAAGSALATGGGDCSTDSYSFSDLQAAVTAASVSDGTVALTCSFSSFDTAGDTLEVPSGGSVTIDLSGNSLAITDPDPGSAGIEVPSTATLTIEDTAGGGVLTADGGSALSGLTGAGAGIGGNAGVFGGDGDSAGTITIRSGTVIATGGSGDGGAGAGIGGGGGSAGIPGAEGTPGVVGTDAVTLGADGGGGGTGGTGFDGGTGGAGGDGGTVHVLGGQLQAAAGDATGDGVAAAIGGGGGGEAGIGGIGGPGGVGGAGDTGQQADAGGTGGEGGLGGAGGHGGTERPAEQVAPVGRSRSTADP